MPLQHPRKGLCKGRARLKALNLDSDNVGWAAAAAIATFVLESFAVQGKITFAVKQCQRYATLLALFPIDGEDGDAKLLKRIRNERLMVEKDETVILECLDVHCHNKQCVAENRLGDMVKLSWFERWIGTVLPFGYNRKA